MIAKPPSVGLIGCGRWGRNIARVLAGKGALAAIAVRRPEAATDMAAAFGVDVMRPETLLARRDVDAIALAVPPQAHRELVEAALAAGKHVFVEKPLALSAVDARALQAAAAISGKVLMVGHIMRHNPAFVRLLEMARAGAVGEIRRVTSLRYVPGSGGDPLWLLAPHDASMLLALLGAPLTVEGERRADEHDIRLGFARGVAAEVRVGRAGARKHSELTVMGETGVLVFEDTAPPGGKLRLNGAAVAYQEVEPLSAELDWFLEAVRGRRAPLADAEEGLAVVDLLEQAGP